MLNHRRSFLLFMPAMVFLVATILSGIVLASTTVSAEDIIISNVDISVPVSCNINSSVDVAHTAIVNAGTSVPDIGTTNFTVFCNDASGFALYAIGYTNEDYGDNTLVGQNLNGIINTGTATSGNNSAWAMKMVKVTDGSYQPNNLTITNSFNDYHNVPDTYTKVAEYTASTDFTLGSKLQSTYRAFISTYQDADTYNGKVKYTLVHPYYTDANALREAITVVYDGNGLTFPDGSTTNTVKYAEICTPGDYGYVANTPYTTVKTSNLNADGTQNANSPYTNSESILQTITVPNADKVKVVVDYGLTDSTGYMTIAEGTWGGWNDGDPSGGFRDIHPNGNISGQKSFVFEENTITIDSQTWDTPISGYDYGYYVKVYAVYDTQQANTTGENLPSDDCSIQAISGSYIETNPWHGKWTATIDETEIEFTKVREEYDYSVEYNSVEEAVLYLIGGGRYDSLTGTTLTLYAYNPVTFDMVYAAANKTKTNNYYAIQDLNSSMCGDVTIGETTTVIDIRDNNTYSIGKLKDGNCWLRDNLKLDPTDSATAASMSASNTNASNDAIYNYLHGGNPNNNAGWTTSAVENSPEGTTTDHNTYTEPFINNGRKNDYHGIYYNFCAVSVGTFCYSYSNGPSTGFSEQDLCPVGWKLPQLSEYNNLYQILGSVKNTAKGLGLSYSGQFSFSNNQYNTGNNEPRYWTSTIRSRTEMSTLRYSGFYFQQDSQNSGPRYGGFSIRCILPVSN